MSPTHHITIDYTKPDGYVNYFVPGPFTQTVHITLSRETVEIVRQAIERDARDYFAKLQQPNTPK